MMESEKAQRERLQGLPGVGVEATHLKKTEKAEGEVPDIQMKAAMDMIEVFRQRETYISTNYSFTTLVSTSLRMRLEIFLRLMGLLGMCRFPKITKTELKVLPLLNMKTKMMLLVLNPPLLSFSLETDH